MGKRKSTSAASAGSDSDDSMSDSTPKILSFDFDFFDLHPTTDYLGIKTLLKQLFDIDNLHFDLSGLTDLVLGEGNREGGTTIKTDGEESDPYAFLAFLDVDKHKANPSLSALLTYISQKSTPNSTLTALLQNPDTHVGLILSERFRNMPVETIPPLYRMLAEELKRGAYNHITHLLIPSRTFHLTPTEASFHIQPSIALPPSSKRSKPHKSHTQSQPPPPEDGLYDFHPEDTLLKQHAVACVDYTFDREGERNEESFGLDTRGRVLLVERGRLEGLVRRLGEVYAPPA